MKPKFDTVRFFGGPLDGTERQIQAGGTEYSYLERVKQPLLTIEKSWHRKRKWIKHTYEYTDLEKTKNGWILTAQYKGKKTEYGRSPAELAAEVLRG